MFTISRSADFAAWLDALQDRTVKARLIRRLQRAEQGNLGDVAAVGQGVSEMREHFGPGWRMGFVQRGSTLIVLLGGGEKSTQARDIAAAKSLAAAIEDLNT